MAEQKDPSNKVVWRGEAASDSRYDRLTGKPFIYEMKAYDDGGVSCTCPAWLVQAKGRKLAEKRQFRCKHLKRALDQSTGVLYAVTAEVTTEPTKGSPPRKRATSARSSTEPTDDLGIDMSDFVPGVRPSR